MRKKRTKTTKVETICKMYCKEVKQYDIFLYKKQMMNHFRCEHAILGKSVSVLIVSLSNG